VKIRIRRNGPYVIEGEVEIEDWDGSSRVTARRPVALCRCGASARKPFCDGSHGRCGFDGTCEEKPDGPTGEGRPGPNS